MTEISTVISKEEGKVAIKKINTRLKRVVCTTPWTCGEEDFLGMYRFLMRQDDHVWRPALKSVAKYVDTLKMYVEQEYPEIQHLAA